MFLEDRQTLERHEGEHEDTWHAQHANERNRRVVEMLTSLRGTAAIKGKLGGGGVLFSTRLS